MFQIIVCLVPDNFSEFFIFFVSFDLVVRILDGADEVLLCFVIVLGGFFCFAHFDLVGSLLQIALVVHFRECKSEEAGGIFSLWEPLRAKWICAGTNQKPF
jgi:hypothetical protein